MTTIVKHWLVVVKVDVVRSQERNGSDAESKIIVD